MAFLSGEPDPLVVSLSRDGSECLTFDVGVDRDWDEPLGWAAFHSPIAGTVSIQLRFGPDSPAPDAAVEIRELSVAAAGPEFGSPLLRRIPFARIIAAVNRLDVIGDIRGLLGKFELDEVIGGGSQRLSWRQPPTDPVALEVPALTVSDPGGRRKPDEFYARVAELFLILGSISNRPAQDLADANGLPVSTIHRWVKEARTRGILRLPRTRTTEDRSSND